MLLTFALSFGAPLVGIAGASSLALERRQLLAAVARELRQLLLDLG
jgi:hypothetical protein